MTQQEIYEKLVSLVPSWYFQDPDVQQALAYGQAKIFEQIATDVQEHFDATFIERSEGEFLDEHGYERTTPRFEGEADNQYQIRVRNLSAQYNIHDLKSILDKLVITGSVEIREDWKGDAFFNRESFFNRATIVLDDIVNVFTIVVDKQVRRPDAFFNREFFFNRSSTTGFIGSSVSSDYVFRLLVEATNQYKAKGTLYRIIERSN